VTVYVIAVTETVQF